MKSRRTDMAGMPGRPQDWILGRRYCDIAETEPRPGRSQRKRAISLAPVAYAKRQSAGHLTLQRLELAAVRRWMDAIAGYQDSVTTKKRKPESWVFRGC